MTTSMTEGIANTDLGAATGAAPASSGDMEFWDWLVGSGLIDGDPKYYSGGDAAQEAGAYSHAITTALLAAPPGSAERKELVDRLYAEKIITSADSPEARAYWEECRNLRETARKFGLSPNTVKTRARREGWNK